MAAPPIPSARPVKLKSNKTASKSMTYFEDCDSNSSAVMSEIEATREDVIKQQHRLFQVWLAGEQEKINTSKSLDVDVLIKSAKLGDNKLSNTTPSPAVPTMPTMPASSSAKLSTKKKKQSMMNIISPSKTRPPTSINLRSSKHAGDLAIHIPTEEEAPSQPSGAEPTAPLSARGPGSTTWDQQPSMPASLRAHVDSLQVRKTSIAAARMLINAQKEGYLWHQVSKKWKKRWFVLSRRSITYFNTCDDTKPLGIISLDKAVLGMSPEPDKQKPFLLQLVSPDKVYRLAADDKESLESWTLAISNLGSCSSPLAASKKSNSSSDLQNLGAPGPEPQDKSYFNYQQDKGDCDEDGPPPSGPLGEALKSGFLHKRSTKGVSKNWTRFWFVLETGRLWYFKGQKDTLPKGALQLDGSCVVASNESKAKQFSFSLTCRNNTWLLAAHDGPSAESWTLAIKEASSCTQ